jgi:predicted dehydrogenase
MNTSDLRVLIVGTGFGCRIQVPAFRAAGFDVVGLVGTNSQRTAQRAEESDVLASFTDFGRAIEETGATVVAISTPPFTHGPLAIEALERGCHVLCEKPFARDAAEANAMLEAAEKAGKVHILGNEFRFVPQRAAIARAIADGMIGEPRLASLVQYSGYVSSFEEDIPDWWFDPDQGGGWLGCSGSHAIDQIRCWLGEFTSLSGALATATASRGPVEDSFSTRFTLENGVEGVLHQCAGDYGPYAELTRISGTQGTLWTDGPRVLFADRNGVRELPIPADLTLPPPPPFTRDPRHARLEWQMMAAVEIAPYTQLCGAIRAAITGEASPSPIRPATFLDGIKNMAVQEAIRASARNGGSVQVL